MDVDNKYGTLEMQNKLLALLKEFHGFCVINDIKYSLDWGSLLGAIRHKGFIPWDDDLDIMVDRDNYIKIKSLTGGKLVYEHGTPSALWIDRIRLDSDALSAPKPTMDVFVIDNAPNGKLSRKIRVVLIRALQGALKDKPDFKKGNLFYRVATSFTYLVGRCFRRRTILSLYEKLSTLSNSKITKMKACYNADFVDVAKIRHNNVVDEYIIVPFEDTEVYVTKYYHQALLDMFGPNYMTPVYREPIHLTQNK